MSSLYKDIVLPGTSFSGNIFLAPMAGWTDVAFRSICSEFGASACYSEMISCEALIRNSEKTEPLLMQNAEKQETVFQLFGSNPDSAYLSIKKIAKVRPLPLMIDFNCGCPVPKVTKTGAGSALMNDIPNLTQIIKSLKKGLEEEDLSIPISIKIRSGWDAQNRNYIDVAKSAEDAGIDLIGIHPRTKKQGYSGNADYEVIAKLKKAVDIPVIGSGDLYSPEDIKNMLQTTNCDGVMVARGAVGNPQIFRQTKELLLENSIKTKLSDYDRLILAMKQYSLTANLLGDNYASKEMKKHLCSYTKGIQNGKVLRNELVHCKEKSEFEEKIENFIKDYHLAL